jgi:transcriptional regulator with XRE-family HTH domain
MAYTKETIEKNIGNAETGANIKRLYEEQGWTVKDLQEIFKIENPSAIYKWLRGESLPSRKKLLVLAELFDVKVMDIIKLEEPKENEKNKRKRGNTNE